MPTGKTPRLKDGDACLVVAGTHKGKSGIARDLNVSKTGHLTITVVQVDGVRFKTLGRNVVVQTRYVLALEWCLSEALDYFLLTGWRRCVTTMPKRRGRPGGRRVKLGVSPPVQDEMQFMADHRENR